MNLQFWMSIVFISAFFIMSLLDTVLSMLGSIKGVLNFVRGNSIAVPLLYYVSIYDEPETS